MTGKIHIAGEPKDGVQRCTQCACLLAKYTKTYQNFWPVGLPIYTRRLGMCRAPGVEGVEYHDCKGRRKRATVEERLKEIERFLPISLCEGEAK